MAIFASQPQSPVRFQKEQSKNTRIQSLMKRREFLQHLAIGAGAAALSPHCLFGKTPSPSDGKADWIYKGGLIYTVDPAQPSAEVVAVRGDQIVFVGSANSVGAWQGLNTRIVNLDGGMLMPGFVDAHAHPESGVSKVGLDLTAVKGKEAILSRVREYVAKHPGTDVLRGFGWNPSEIIPSREWLDPVTGERPLYLISFDAHDIWFNTAAMKAAGIGANTPDPAPGAQYFVRGTDGVPTGYGVEVGALMRVAVPLGVFSPQNVRASQALMLDPAPSWGVTSLFNAGIIIGEHSQDAQWVYEELIKRDKAGNLPVRLTGCAWTRSGANDPKMIVAHLADWNKNLKSEHLKIDICKLWSDGTVLSGGALLLEPFADQKDNYGRMTFAKAEIVAQALEVQKAGFDMHIHVDADGSARTVLDALEEVQKQLGVAGRRHVVTHNSTVHPKDIPRYKAQHLIANCTPMWGTNYNGDYIETFTKALGSRRVEEEIFPYGDLVRSGAIVTYGSDVPGIEIPDAPPLMGLEAAVTRRRPGHSNDPVFVARQKVTLAQAIQCYTNNGAYQMRLEDQVGSIAVGKKADLVFLEKDLFKVSPDTIHSTKVVQTMMDGNVTHSLL
jgi:predicted amidohydrolase YtcJ